MPVFHSCVRLAKWKESPGQLSFIPPDGKFMLAGYEVDLLPTELDLDKPPSQSEKVFLPATIDLTTGLGSNGSDFEARLTLNTNFPGVQTLKPSTTPGRSATPTPTFSFGSTSSGSTAAPSLESVVVSIPLPAGVRTVSDLRASRGEAHFQALEKSIEWKVPTKDGARVSGTATLFGTVIGPPSPEEDVVENDADAVALSGYYDEDTVSPRKQINPTSTSIAVESKRKQANKALMPRSVAVSFTVRGWLPSGIKVDSLMVDVKKSRGLGEGVKPYKGVKYMTVSRKGVERRV